MEYTELRGAISSSYLKSFVCRTHLSIFFTFPFMFIFTLLFTRFITENFCRTDRQTVFCFLRFFKDNYFSVV